jgi:hypothetical protein
MSTNRADEIVSAVLEGMQVDAGWMYREGSAVDWWPQRLRQRVEHGHSMQHGRSTFYKIRVTTDCLREVEESKELYEYIARYNQDAVLSAMVYHPVTRKLFLASTLHLCGDQPQFGFQIALHTVALQVAEAYVLVDGFEIKGWPKCFVAGKRRAQVDESAHPTSGRRVDYDEILGVRGPYLIHGTMPSAFELEWFEALEGLSQTPSVRTTVAENGLTAEFPFGAGPAIPAMPGVRRPSDARTSLLRLWSSVCHPRFGSGCLVALDIPDMVTDPKAANALNLWELQSAAPMSLTGGWAWTERGCVGYRSFFPSFMAQAAFADLAFYEAASRSRAIAGLLQQS